MVPANFEWMREYEVVEVQTSGLGKNLVKSNICIEKVGKPL